MKRAHTGWAALGTVPVIFSIHWNALLSMAAVHASMVTMAPIVRLTLMNARMGKLTARPTLNAKILVVHIGVSVK